MIVLRSIVFNGVFYVNIIVQMILWTPYFFLAPRRKAWFVPKFWARTSLWLQKMIAGTDNEITGLENIPDGPYILAPKHQSFWDVIAFLPFVADGMFILKRELTYIPLFGWYVAKMDMVPIDRKSRSKALKKAIREVQERMVENRQLIIYAEGTRRSPGAEPAYKYGIVEIYARLGIPVVPVAHNAGLYWPRRKFLRYPGTIRARFLPPIEAGLDREEFLARLIAETESACDALLIEAARSHNPPPMPPTALKRLGELGVEIKSPRH